MTARLLIVGTGLIGTSIGLALGGVDVVVVDPDEEHLTTAVDRGAGRRWNGEAVHHAVLALPPRRIAAQLRQLQQRAAAQTFSHVASAQAVLQVDIETSGGDSASICGSHPMAGRERSGPLAATADLFAGRPWVLCPSPSTTTSALDATRQLALDCGGEPVELTAAEHDAGVALVSHLPQVAASAVAAVLLSAPRSGDGDGLLRLAGPGLQDTTRVASSDPALWTDVLRQNAAAVAPLVRALAAELDEAAQALQRLADGDSSGSRAVQDLLVRGRAGRQRVPVKHGEQDSAFARVSIGVSDRPGQLAGLLVSAAEAGINVEDVRVEHLAGRPRGVIELLVQDTARTRARRALAAAGWEVLA